MTTRSGRPFKPLDNMTEPLTPTASDTAPPSATPTPAGELANIVEIMRGMLQEREEE